jgi:ribosomal-protein-alanine N-acetyltransferase
MNFTYETPRLQIRILNGTNAAQALAFYNEDRELFERYEPTRPRNFYTENYHRYLMNYEYNQILKGVMVRYWLFPKEQPGRIIGTVSLRNIMRGSYNKCEIGYKLSSAYQRQGYAREGIARIIQIAFTELDMHRIEACCMPGNEPSINLLESLNFQLEGKLRKFAKIQGQYEDHLLFSLIH